MRAAPGRTRVALAKIISSMSYSVLATRHIPAHTHVLDCRPDMLWPAQGAWRTNTRLDTQPWNGQVGITTTYHHQDKPAEVWTQDTGISSWFTMTDLVRSKLCDFDFDCGYEINPVDINATTAARTARAHTTSMASLAHVSRTRTPKDPSP